jgi:predicted DNA-binding transcriptional regulator AlpA
VTDYVLAPVVARKLGVKTATLAKWRQHGRGPRGWVRYSPTAVAYPTHEVEAWLAEQKGEAA